MIEKDLLSQLYNVEKLSQQDIANRLHVNVKQVVYWMEKYGISRRNRSDATYWKRNFKGEPFQIKKILSSDERELFGLGIGLYWGEGTKSNKNSIRLGNTDPNLIKKFIKFLKIICGINTNKLKFGLQIFNDIKEEEALKFWMEQLSCGKDRFQKVIVSLPQGKGTYKKKSKYGVLTIYFHNKKLRDWLISQINILRLDRSDILKN